MTTETAVLTVSDLNLQIKDLLEPRFMRIQVKGEVSNLKIQSSGHAYFTLKDEASQISAVCFAGSLKKLSRPPKEGDKVIVIADLSLYLPRGNYQLVIRSIEYEGIGALLLKLHALKASLNALGYFDTSRKKKIPPFPKTIGVITSPTGAVIQDIIHILKRRAPNFNLLLYPVKVQGDGAAEEIAKAIREMNHFKLADVLIVGRGGGSLEDLWAFNEKVVADALFESKIPTISAVGHETDHSICDYVADLRAPTPSAAAEIVSQEGEALKAKLKSQERHLFTLFSAKVEGLMQRLDDLTSGLESRLFQILQKRRYQISERSKVLKALSPLDRLNFQKQKLAQNQKALQNRLKEQLNRLNLALKGASGRLFALDPKALLAKGYLMALDPETQKPITKAKQAPIDRPFSLLFSDGALKVKTFNMEDPR